MSFRPHALAAAALVLGIAAACARGTAASATSASSVRADDAAALREQPPLLLWPAGAPGAVGDSAEDRPTITPYLPPPGRATGAAAVIFPGGGYLRVATEKEGVPTARWLTAHGVTAFIVRYRLGPRYRHPAMLQDGQRAVRTVRARAAEWGIDPQRVAVVGYSAGGHLASTVGTHVDAGRADDADPVERVSARPDLMLLVYPVVTMDARLTHRNSRTRLIGEQPDSAIVRLLSNETQVHADTPPTFLVASTDDATVPVENTIMLYRALRDARVPVELHVFETGRHGFGLALDDPALSAWSTLGTTWLRRHGWLDARGATAGAR